MGLYAYLHGVERTTPLTHDEMRGQSGLGSSKGNAVPLLWFGFFRSAHVRWINPNSAGNEFGYHEIFAPRDVAFANLRAFARGLCYDDTLRPHVNAAIAALESGLTPFAGVQMDYSEFDGQSMLPDDLRWWLPYVEGIIDGRICEDQIFHHPLAEGLFATAEMELHPPRTVYGGTILMKWLLSGLGEFCDETK
jgi:hypothetical protein